MPDGLIVSSYQLISSEEPLSRARTPVASSKSYETKLYDSNIDELHQMQLSLQKQINESRRKRALKDSVWRRHLRMAASMAKRSEGLRKNP